MMLRVISGLSIAGLAFLLLLMPALYNGSPIYWYDSMAYLHGGSSALNTTIGFETRFRNMERATPPKLEIAGSQHKDAKREPSSSAATESHAPETEYRISMARSPYYSAILVFLSGTYGPFAPVAGKALLIVAIGFLLLRAVFKSRITTPALYLLAALSVSTAGVFCATLLPDILAPVGIISVAVLFCFYDNLSNLDRGLWFGILVFSIVSHTSHIAITFILIPIGVVLAVLRQNGRARAPLLICLLAVAVGFLSLQTFSRAVESIYGYKPRPFPMIAASVIVDGPGLNYLMSTCPENGYVYCDYIDTKAQNIDEFLWSTDKATGVYVLADREARTQMSDQQVQFLIDVLTFDFAAQFRASFERFLEQLQKNSLAHLTYTKSLTKELTRVLPNPERQLLVESAAYFDRFPFRGFSILTQVFSVLALIGTLIVLARARSLGTSNGSSILVPPLAVMISFVVIVLCGIVANAGITGVVSNPQGRYGARVIWLLLVMFAVVLAWYHRNSEREAKTID